MSDLLTIIEMYQGTNEIASFESKNSSFDLSKDRCDDSDDCSCDGWDCDCHGDYDNDESDCGHWN